MTFSLFLLIAGIGFTGCSKGNVPNSDLEQIEAAKFDADKPKGRAMGTVTAPR